MSSSGNNQQGEKESDFAGLPFQPESSSELLASTCVFRVEILTIGGTNFTRGDDGLERRRLIMNMRLGEVFKGQLDVQEDQTFTLDVEQIRESEFFETDFHGIWSHIEPEVAAHYIVVSKGPSQSPADLMQEESLMYLLGGPYEVDIRLALEAERLLRTADDALLAAASTLLGFARGKKKEVKDVFGRYLWARVESSFLAAPDRILPDILGILLDDEATLELRRALVSDLYAAVLLLEPDLDLFREVIVGLFSLLQQPSASPLHNTLVEAQLYNLVLKEGQPRLPVDKVFPDQAERDGLKARLASLDTDRARRLSSWLNSVV